jgi:ATP-dependent DNA helicase RecQ
MHQLRPFQSQALSTLQIPGHLLCIAPTGSGKSLIYERMAVKSGFKTLLVSPLVALARQQQIRLNQLKVNTYSNNVPAPHETGAWIASPESLIISSRARALKAWKPDLMVVDECHCLWDWGENFRTCFQTLPELIDRCSIERSLLLTATLPFHARQHLREQIPAPLTEIGAFELPARLKLKVVRVPWKHRAEALLEWSLKQQCPGIVFVNTRESAERGARLLSYSGKRALHYHAGMSSEERRAIETMISKGAIDVVVATSAFGMGMDMPHLHWAVIWQAPASLLWLTQAIGRVARSNSQGEAIVFWDFDDFKLIEWMIEQSPRLRQEVMHTLIFLESFNCRRILLGKYFGEAEITHCKTLCDYCIAAFH